MVIRDDVLRSVVAIFDTVSVLTFSVEKPRWVALMLDAVKVELTVTMFDVIVLPKVVIVFNVLNCIVKAVILDTEIVVAVIVLPANVENPICSPLIIVEPIIDETMNVFP